MVKYRQDATTETTARSSSQPRAAAAAPLRTLTYTRLADKYGMSDMRITDPSSLQMQTIEQEFQAYITAQLSVEGTNMIKFWEVCAIWMSNYSG
jgi:hypothetical protein